METDLDVVSIVLVYPDGTRRREQHRSDKTIGDLLADVRANSTMAELHSVVLRDRSAELSGDSNALPASMKLKKVHGHCLVVHMTNRVNSVMRGTTSAARPFCTHHKMAGACTRCVNDPAYQLRRAGFEVRESDSGLVVSFEYEGFRHQWVMTDPGNAALGGAVQRARGVKRAVCQMIENNVHRDRAMQAELDAIDRRTALVVGQSDFLAVISRAFHRFTAWAWKHRRQVLLAASVAAIAGTTMWYVLYNRRSGLEKVENSSGSIWTGTTATLAVIVRTGKALNLSAPRSGRRVSNADRVRNSPKELKRRGQTEQG